MMYSHMGVQQPGVRACGEYCCSCTEVATFYARCGDLDDPSTFPDNWGDRSLLFKVYALFMRFCGY